MPPRDSTTVTDVRREAPAARPDEGTRGLTAKPKPHPVLQARFNFHGSVEEFNRRLEVIDKSHREQVGYRPSGALAYDIARSPVKDEQVPVLFQVPRTKKAAVARSYGVPRTGEDVTREAFVPPPQLSDDELYAGLETARKKGARELRLFYREHRDRLDPAAALRAVYEGETADDDKDARFVKAGGVLPDDVATGIIRTTILGLVQVSSALTVGPATLALEEGRAAKASIEQKSLRPLGRTNWKLASAAVTGFYEDGKAVVTGDWEYIKENPGFIALDIMGLGSLVAKPVVSAGGRTTTRKGGLEVERLESENAAAALLQRRNRRKEQKDANTRHDTEDVFVDHSRLGYVARKHLGFEKKIGRELERERKLQVALRDMVRKDLERVTGWSTRTAAVRDKVGVKAHRGLTRGEQMGLFIESLDVAGSFKDRAAALRAAHEKWRDDGIGDPAAHEQKLRDIKLAERALKKPSPRFEKALVLTREAVAEMEELKVRELGLDASVASGRVARAGEVVRTGEKLEDFDTPPRARSDSHYVPTVAPRQSRPLAKNPFRSKRFGAFGASLPDIKALVPELQHQFTGKAMQAGDYRIDTTRLIGESVGRTVRAAALISQHQKLLKAATDRPRSEFDRPIRTKDGVPDELRDILARTDEGELVGDEVAALSKMDAEKMIAELFPGQRGPDGRWLISKEIDGVKWVDERLLDPEAFVQPMQTPAKKVAAAVNAPFTTTTLYLRPAYLLNLAGATANAFIYQGMFAPPNIMRAVASKNLYGEKVTNALRDLVGSGRAMSYVEGRPVTQATQQVARFWNTITDERLRMASAYYYARKEGVKTRAQWETLLDAAKAGDEASFKTLNAIVTRAKKSQVEFDNLSQFERDVLRHAIFIYPWTKGSAVWSVRTMVERPVTTATLAQLGADELEDIQDVFTERVPEWFKNAGYVPLGYDKDGNPRVTMPAGLSTFSTLGGLLHQRIEQMLGPAAELLVRGVTERDEFGNEYESPSRPGRWVDAAVDVLTGLPQVKAVERSRKKGEVTAPVDVTDRGSLAASLNDALKRSVFSPGWLDGYGKLITGATATPVSVDKQALLARWYREASFEDRAKLQKELLNRALAVQADLIGKPVALDVKKLVNLQFDRDKQFDAWQREHSRDATPAEETLHDLAFYKSRNLIPAADFAKLVKQVPRLADEDEHASFRREVFEQYADPDGKLREWDESVRRVNALATPKIVNERLRRLSENGVNDASGRTTLTRDQLVEYGRKADAYTREYRRRVLELAQLRKSDPALVPAAEADLVAWKSEQDKPVSVQGRLLPSPARMEWAKEWDYDARVEDVAELASRPWSSLTRFEKELLGKKTDPHVVRGWQELEAIVAEQRIGPDGGTRTIPDSHLVNLAKYVNGDRPGFFQEFLFARQPLFRRLEKFRPVQQSPNVAKWRLLFADARIYEARRKEKAVQALWKTYANDTLRAEVDADPAFAAELALYGDNLLEGLIS